MWSQPSTRVQSTIPRYFRTLAGVALASLAVTLALAGGKQGGKTAFEARAEPASGVTLSSPVLAGDTALNDPSDHCEGTLVPDNNRGFFTEFRNCLDDITLPGKNGTIDGGGDDIVIDRGSMNALQDKNTGDVVGVRWFFMDRNDNQYQTDFISVSPAQPVSTTGSFTVEVLADAVEVRPVGAQKNKPVVGHVSIGQVVYTPK